MYSEFLEGAKIPDGPVSWSIFNCLHKFYMQTDAISKEQVYSRGETLYKDIMSVVKPDITAHVVLMGDDPHCGKCGTAIAGNENYCPECGARLLMEKPEHPLRVPDDFWS